MLARAAVLVDDDPVRDLETGGLGELGRGLDAEARDDRVRGERPPALEAHRVSVASPLDPGDELAREHLDAVARGTAR